MPVRRMDKVCSKRNKNKDSCNLQQDHYIVRLSRLANAAHQHHRQYHDDEKRGPVKAEVPPRSIKRVSVKILKAAWKIGRRNPSCRWVNAEPVHQVHNMGGKTYTHCHVGEGV